MDSTLEVEVGAGARHGEYVVRVVHAAAGGEPSATLMLDVDDLRARRNQVEATVLASAVVARGRTVPEAELPVQTLGQELFEALFAGPVKGVYRASLGAAQERGKPLQVVLRLTAPELAVLPWEALFDPDTETYLCRSVRLVRHVPSAFTPEPLEVTPPLRILGLVASPRGYVGLNVKAEKARLTKALAKPIAAGLVELVWVSATWGAVHGKLLDEPWHVLHFVGHGEYNARTEEGALAFVGRNGGADLVEANRLVDLLREAQPIPRLVVLNSCSSAQGGGQDLFSGTAAALVRSGITAVAAMQFSISDQAAIAFAGGFYSALARGRGIDEAANSGRVAILGLDSLEWLTPVLYLLGNAHRLFRISAAPPETDAPVGRGRIDRSMKSARLEDVSTPADPLSSSAWDGGISALYARRFGEAVELLTAARDQFPDNPHVRSRLDEAQARRDLAEWFDEGSAAAERADWDQAVRAFARVTAADATYRDDATYQGAQDRLKRARRQQRRLRLMEDIHRLFDARNWAAAVVAAQELAELDPASPDPDGIVSQARAELANEDLAARYRAGLHQLDQDNWDAAFDTFTGIERQRPGYRDSAALIAHAHRRQEDLLRAEQIHELEARLRRGAEQNDWAAVVSAGEELALFHPDTPDPDGLVTRAREEIENAELATRHAVVRHVDQEDWSAALEMFRSREMYEDDFPDDDDPYTDR